MDHNDSLRIALIISTDGLEYDDRVRKEYLSIKRLYPHCYFKIFVMLPENKEISGVTSYGAPFHSVYLKSRDKYPQAKRIIRKSIDFYRTIKKEIRSFDAIWCANDETALFVALAKKDHLLWDQHELPPFLLDSHLRRLLLKYLFSRCKVVVHANRQRKEYLEDIGLIRHPEKHFVLRNYSEINSSETMHDEAFRAFNDWKKGKQCVYLQGLFDNSRAAYETISAVLLSPPLHAVVVGPFHGESMVRLEQEFGSLLKDRVLFVGKIAQSRIPQYMMSCCMSLVFYRDFSPNNFFCEANRLYMAILAGLPVVVGNNPTMKELIDKYRFGISIDDDGRHVGKIVDGIHALLAQYDLFYDSVQRNKKIVSWDAQDPEIRQIIDVLMS